MDDIVAYARSLFVTERFVQKIPSSCPIKPTLAAVPVVVDDDVSFNL